MSATSNGSVSFSRKVAMLAGLAVLTAAGVADAVPLGPGGAGAPTGTDAISDPTLVGPVMAAQIIPFTCGGTTGELQNWVIRNPSGEMDIYYVFVNYPGSNDRIVGGILEDYSVSSIVDFDYRTDLGGAIQPRLASRSVAGDQIQLTFRGAISSGSDSMPIVARTGRTDFDDFGSVTVQFGTIAPCVINNTYQPK